MKRFLRGADSNDRLMSVTDRAGATPTGTRIVSSRSPAPRSRTAVGSFAKSDNLLRLEDELDHDGLCHREQEYFLSAIRDDLDLTDHQYDALASMRMAEGP